MRKEDISAAESKKRRINDLMRQAAEANAQALIEKEKRIAEEKEHTQKIISYQ